MEALTVAKYVINFAIQAGCPISNLQLQKILYFLNGEYHEATNEWLIGDAFLSYPLGPVNKEVYRTYRGYGASKIWKQDHTALDREVQQDVVDRILKKRVCMSARQLVDESHQREGAWKKTIQEKGQYAEIEKAWICAEFAKH